MELCTGRVGFAAVWIGYEIAWSVFNVPRLIGPLAAFAIAAFVTIDPIALFWPRDSGANRLAAAKHPGLR